MKLNADNLERFSIIWSLILLTTASPLLLIVLLFGFLTADHRTSFHQESDSQSVTGIRRGTLSDTSVSPAIKSWRTMEGGLKFAQFETVFWDPKDTISMRSYLSNKERVQGRSVLEIGTGTGIVALTCLAADPARVVALDINPNAVANAQYNYEHLRSIDRLGLAQFEVRLVPEHQQNPFAVLQESERFDLIVSNPPWEDAAVESLADYALYDLNFKLLRTLLDDSREFLKPGGELLLAYGCKSAIRRIKDQAPKFGWTVETLDDRELSELPEVFLPGMLLRLTQSKQQH